MQLEVGSIEQGKITGITKFGAFVELESGQTGLVHISEIADTYVNNVSDFFDEGDVVKVKVLSTEGNKIAFSIKQSGMPLPQKRTSNNENRGSFQDDKPKRPARPKSRPQVYRGAQKKEEPKTFEDMLSRFKQSSEEKMCDIKRNIDSKRGSYSRKK